MSLVSFDITSVSCSSLNANSEMPSGRCIDLFTNKKPFSGKGLNQPSDAFAPQEKVVLYAFVTYNGYPVIGKLVAYEIHGPPNPLRNFTLYRTAVTNESGIAETSFIVPWIWDGSQKSIFGTWNVTATVDIAGQIVSDNLSFKVGWIIEVSDFKTTNSNFEPKNKFNRGEFIYFKFKVKNIAFTEKTATFVVSVSDDLCVVLGQIILENENVPSGEKIICFGKILIPQWASVGEGKAVLGAYNRIDDKLIPLCPSISTTFKIGEVAVPEVIDASILGLCPNATKVESGQVVNFTINVQNQGNLPISFNLTLWGNSTIIGKLNVTNLAPCSGKTVSILWDTTGVPAGHYTITATIPPLPGEVDLHDNCYTNGVVEVLTAGKPSPFSLWFLLLIILALAVIITLTTLYLRRRKEREGKGVFAALVSLK